jgi:hypothetical protein
MNVLTKDQVNTSCDDCKRDVPAVVAIQGDGRYPIWVCLTCLHRAVSKLNNEGCRGCGMIAMNCACKED